MSRDFALLRHYSKQYLRTYLIFSIFKRRTDFWNTAFFHFCVTLFFTFKYNLWDKYRSEKAHYENSFVAYCVLQKALMVFNADSSVKKQQALKTHFFFKTYLYFFWLLWHRIISKLEQKKSALRWPIFLNPLWMTLDPILFTLNHSKLFFNPRWVILTHQFNQNFIKNLFRFK